MRSDIARPRRSQPIRAPRPRPSETARPRRTRIAVGPSILARIDPHLAAFSTPAPAVAAVVVAVPARDEAATIARCLASIDRAAAGCAVPVVVVVAADACHDDTAHIARSAPTCHTTVRVVEGRWRGASRARAAAINATLGTTATSGLATVWIANTDADCVVPPTWLRRQLRHADRGVAAVAGTVALDPATTPERLLADFTATYTVTGRTHHHVHASNFGVRADAYRLVGGWSAHTMVGEDHDLWRRLSARRLGLIQPTDVTVTTSSRTSGRIIGGFATRLSRLERHHGDQPLSAS